MTVEIEIEDDACIPHDRAVWRRRTLAPAAAEPEPDTERKRVCVQYSSGRVVAGRGESVSWVGCLRWRYGWPPRRER